uniref:Uncharacterized protein n=1 Tax=Tetranychus urticae TaxID=32264 RepID=T1JS22_TETUR
MVPFVIAITGAPNFIRLPHTASPESVLLPFKVVHNYADDETINFGHLKILEVLTSIELYPYQQ